MQNFETLKRPLRVGSNAWRFSLLQRSALSRLGLAVILLALLWTAIWWASLLS